MTQVMHLPTPESDMTLCGRRWDTYLLSPGEAYPICEDCWAVQQYGGVPVPDPLLPKGERLAIGRRVGEVIKATAERLDLPRRVQSKED